MVLNALDDVRAPLDIVDIQIRVSCGTMRQQNDAMRSINRTEICVSFHASAVDIIFVVRAGQPSLHWEGAL